MSAHDGAGGGRRASHIHEEVLPSNRSNYLSKTQAEMWAEFNTHFRNAERPAAKVNHHDFLDGNFLAKLKDQQSRRLFFSNVGGRSLDQHPLGTPSQDGTARTDSGAAVDLGRHRLVASRKNYAKLASGAVEIPLNKEKSTIPRWLRNKLESEGKSGV